MVTAAKKGSKPIFQTARPYTETQWPALEPEQRANIVDLLCSCLKPLGDHRKTHIQPSKGKKRKRNAEKTVTHAQADPIPPQTPVLQSHILIGLNSVTRHLEALAAQTAPPSAPISQSVRRPISQSVYQPTTTSQETKTTPSRALAIILIPHPNPSSSIPHAHLPTLMHLSTLDSPPSTATRLLCLPQNLEARIAEALHIPRVGALGILEGAPGTEALVAYVRENIGITRCAWIDEAMKGDWKGVRIEEASAVKKA